MDFDSFKILTAKVTNMKDIYQFVANITKMTSQMSNSAFACVAISLLLTSSLSLFYQDDDQGVIKVNVFSENIITNVWLVLVCLHLIIVRVQKKLNAELTDRLLKGLQVISTSPQNLAEAVKLEDRIAKEFLAVTAVFVFTVFHMGSLLAKGIFINWFKTTNELSSNEVSHEAWIHWIVWGVSGLGALSASLGQLCWYSTFICNSYFITAKLKVLTRELKLLDDKTLKRCQPLMVVRFLESIGDETREETISEIKSLKDITRGHVEIIGHTRMMDKACRWYLMFYVELAIVCLSYVIVAMEYDWHARSFSIESYTRLATLFTIVFFIFKINHCGQQIMDEYENLRMTLYNLEWVSKPLPFQKHLLIMLTVATRPPKLTIGCVVPLKMETFKKVMEASYSLITFLVQVKRSIK